MSSANVYFVEFELVNIYLWNWSLKLFDSFLLIHYDCVRGMVTNENEKPKTNFRFEFQCSVISRMGKPVILMFSASTSV